MSNGKILGSTFSAWITMTSIKAVLQPEDAKTVPTDQESSPHLSVEGRRFQNAGFGWRWSIPSREGMVTKEEDCREVE